MTAQPLRPGTKTTIGERVREPWLLFLHGTALTVRGARPRDLPAAALMHRRCSPKSLLDRYRTGGRAPAIIVLDRYVRDPLSFAVTTDDGRIVALARVADDAQHGYGSGEISMLVEDAWQGIGIGRALLQHVAAAAAVSGYRQLISYPGTTSVTIQRLMSSVGTTRLMSDGPRHLHTTLPDNVKLGLGSFAEASSRSAVNALG